MKPFFRIVKNNPPVIEDFVAAGRWEVDGRPRPFPWGRIGEELEHRLLGVSAFDTQEAALDAAGRYRATDGSSKSRIGDYIVELALPDDPASGGVNGSPSPTVPADQEYFEIWDFESSNLIGTFDSEAEALAVVRAFLDTDYPGYLDNLGLGHVAADGSTIRVVDGHALAALARQSPN